MWVVSWECNLSYECYATGLSDEKIRFFQGLFGLDRAISFQTADVSKMRGVRVHFCNGDIWRQLPRSPSSLVGGKLIPTRMNDPMYLKPQLWQAALLPGSIAVGTKCNRFFGGVMSCHRSQPAVVSDSPLEFCAPLGHWLQASAAEQAVMQTHNKVLVESVPGSGVFNTVREMDVTERALVLGFPGWWFSPLGDHAGSTALQKGCVPVPVTRYFFRELMLVGWKVD